MSFAFISVTQPSLICCGVKRGSIMTSLHESKSRSMCVLSLKMVVEPSVRLYARIPSKAPRP